MVRLANTRQLLLGLLAALVFVGTFAPLANAAENESITLSPTSKRYDVKAGTSITDELVVLNDGEVPFNFSVYANPYAVDPVTYNPDYSSTKANADVYRWVSFAKTDYRADVRETVKVPFTVNVPKTASPGGHYGVVFAEVQPNEDVEQTISRKKRVGMIIRVTVDGKVNLAGTTKSIETNWFQNKAPLTSNVTVENSGNTDFDTTVRYDVQDIFGNPRFQQTQSYVVFPETTRPIKVVWEDVPWLGLYKVNVAVTALDETTEHSSYVLMAPTWFVYTIIAIGGAGVFYGIRKAQRKK